MEITKWKAKLRPESIIYVNRFFKEFSLSIEIKEIPSYRANRLIIPLVVAFLKLKGSTTFKNNKIPKVKVKLFLRKCYRLPNFNVSHRLINKLVTVK